MQNPNNHQDNSGGGDNISGNKIITHNYLHTNENRSELDAYNRYLDAATANQEATTSQPIIGKTVEDLDPDQINKFLNLDRVKNHFLEWNIPTDADLNTKLRSLHLMTNGYVVKGTFLCLTHLFNLGNAGSNEDLASYGAFDTLDKYAVRVSEQVYGNLIQQYQKLMSYILKELSPLQIIDLVKRELDYSIPELVIQELLANAIVHRDYNSTKPFHVWVELYPDRIVIANAGTLPTDLDLSKPNTIISPLFNKEIARIFFLYRFIELKGGGIARVQNLLSERKMKPALFEQKNGFVQVTVYKKQNAQNTASPSLTDLFRQLFAKIGF
jgi:predicted HTH transcriptional regulator